MRDRPKASRWAEGGDDLLRDYQKQNMGTLSPREETPLEMTKEKKPSAETLARQIWLNYYNDYLLEHGVISREMWRKMRLAIGQD